MGLGAILPDDLPDLKFTQPPDHPRSERQAEGQRRQARSGRADRDVPRHVQHSPVRARIEKPEEQVKQHQANSAFSRSTTRSVRTPRDPLTSTRSPPFTTAAVAPAASSLVAK